MTVLTPVTPVTVVIPSYNEAENVGELIGRLDTAFAQQDTGHRTGDVPHHVTDPSARPEVLYVDDSTDDTPARVREAAAHARHLDVRVLHRDEPTGGLAGSGREWASAASTLVARWLFPRRLRGCTDPMTGSTTSNSPSGRRCGWPSSRRRTPR